MMLESVQPRTQGTFRNKSTLVDRGHVVSLYCPDFIIVLFDVPGLKLTPFNSVQTCRHILLSFPPSLKINCFIIAQNVGNKAKPRDHDPPRYFRS